MKGMCSVQAVKWAGDVVDNEGMNKKSSKSELLSLDRSSPLRISVLRQPEVLHASGPCSQIGHLFSG